MAKENWATVKDLAEWFNKLVSEGKGDYFVDVDDNLGERYGYVDDKIKNVSIGDFYKHIEG